MAVRRRPGLSFSVAARLDAVASCIDGEHRWDVVDKMGVPPLWKCSACGVYGFVRRKGHGLRNGRMVEYTCSTEKCRRSAKIRSKHRITGGAFAWACCADHATGSRFEGRVPTATVG
jgi:hypothetical protein